MLTPSWLSTLVFSLLWLWRPSFHPFTMFGTVGLCAIVVIGVVLHLGHSICVMQQPAVHSTTSSRVAWVVRTTWWWPPETGKYTERLGMCLLGMCLLWWSSFLDSCTGIGPHLVSNRPQSTCSRHSPLLLPPDTCPFMGKYRETLINLCYPSSAWVMWCQLMCWSYMALPTNCNVLLSCHHVSTTKHMHDHKHQMRLAIMVHMV